ncbi:hypothetical protein [Pseudonocardia parietis]|uniref:Glycerophosphoryl diester phosphodiesterase membrane domain-containing protein n=1 Tax=Pseudonocardia parietis TaxID=570936 RepID=A0ABS4VXN6_9PSEU|nr:hypothetical protein [Pseudonocardia parietis]MBP2368707.1 hypothetical protein [Pseudonocardia parietis]
MSNEPPQGGDPQQGAGGPGPDSQGEQAQGGPPYPQDPATGQQYGRPAEGQQPSGQQPYQPYGQDPSQQQYGQQPYGQQPYGQPQYGEPQYGQQQPYGQPQYGGQQPYGQQYAQPYGGAPAPGYPGTGAPGGTSPDPLVPFSFGDWFSKVIGVVQRSWKPLLIIQVAVYVPVAILQAVLQLLGLQATAGPTDFDPTDEFVGGGAAAVGVVGLLMLVVTLVLGALAQAASVFVIVRDAAQRPYAPQHVFAFAKSRALAVIGWSLLAGLLITIGFILLVLPGLYLAVIFGGALTGVVVIERAGIGRAFTLVNPRFFPVLGRFVVFILLAFVFVIVVSMVSAALALGNPVVAGLISSVLTLPVTLAGAAAAVVIYAENRFHEQNRVHTPVLADEIDRP